NSYVNARLRHQDDEFNARLRIKGKLTDHVQGRKWSFRVIARKAGGFLGMKRFSLQHPGTRNYLCDWLYHRLSAGEGIVALRYGFVRVVLNDEDLGIYAYEEHFDEALLEQNGRIPGPLVRFDPSLFWVHRLNMMQGVRYNEPFAEFQAAALDAYGTKDLLNDPDQKAVFERAVALMDGFRSGELAASQVFHVDLIARRHALLDLVGGHHSMDWSDVKFYFDPVAERFEPVAYESFSAFPIRDLAGAYRFRSDPSERHDLHERFFSDPVIFSAYVGHLERMSAPAYLDSVFQVLEAPLDSASAVLYREFPYKELDRSVYYANQRTIQRVLDVPKPFHAFRTGLKGDTLSLGLQAIGSLPIEITAYVLGEERRVELEPAFVLPPRQRYTFAKLQELIVPVGTDSLATLPMELEWRVLGAHARARTEVFPYAPDRDGVEGSPMLDRKGNIERHPFLSRSPHGEVILHAGEWTLEEDLIVPEGMVFHAFGPIVLRVPDGLRILSRSPLDWKGHEDDPMRIFLGEGATMMVLDASKRSTLRNVHVEVDGQASRSALVFHRSEVNMEHVRIHGSAERDLITVTRGRLTMDDVVLQGGRDQVRGSMAGIELSNAHLSGASDDAMEVKAGELVLAEAIFREIGGVAIKLEQGSECTAKDLSIQSAEKGMQLREASRMRVEGGMFNDLRVGVQAGKEQMRYGHVTVELKNVRMEAVDVEVDQRAGAKVTFNGKSLMPTNAAGGT
ncbi:MAG: CotH kinase family protein, partial [Flavobacteriales bacterium]|nr:CotH kinase family protein [Flavobacteriales bacterium]